MFVGGGLGRIMVALVKEAEAQLIEVEVEIDGSLEDQVW